MGVECPECGAGHLSIIMVSEAEDIWTINEDGFRADFSGTEPVGQKGYRCTECHTSLAKDNDGNLVRKMKQGQKCPQCNEGKLTLVMTADVQHAVLDYEFDDEQKDGVYVHEISEDRVVLDRNPMDSPEIKCTECGYQTWAVLNRVKNKG